MDELKERIKNSKSNIDQIVEENKRKNENKNKENIQNPLKALIGGDIAKHKQHSSHLISPGVDPKLEKRMSSIRLATNPDGENEEQDWDEEENSGEEPKPLEALLSYHERNHKKPDEEGNSSPNHDAAMTKKRYNFCNSEEFYRPEYSNEYDIANTFVCFRYFVF